MKCAPLSLHKKILKLFSKSYGATCVHYLNDTILSLEKTITRLTNNNNDAVKIKDDKIQELEASIAEYKNDISTLKEQVLMLKRKLNSEVKSATKAEKS